VADGGGRTAEEREAARLERERRRAAQSGEPAPDLPHIDPVSQVDPGGLPDPDPTGPVDPAGPGDAADDDGYETGEHDLELASGTRRISHREGLESRQARQPGQPRGRTKARPRVTNGGRARRRPTRNAGHTSGRRRWFGRLASLVALVLAAVLIWFLIELFQPFGTSPHGEVTVIVPAKSTSSQIGDLLAHEGVVSSSFFFEVRATLSGERSSLRSGVYHLQKGMSYGAVLTKLTAAPPAAKVTELTVAEGRRRAQISALLHDQHIKGNYLAATRRTKLLNFRAYGLRHPPPNLEGFLFPDTYQLIDPIRLSALVTDQLTTFKKQFGSVNLRYAERKHLTPYDVLKIASLVEAETPTVHDRPLVASVIYNRLADGMLLGLDSTTQYATGNFTRPLTVSQLHSSSPFNTRTHAGLPPTPIDNPGLASMQAAAHPAQTHYLYFFATPCSRNSVFASSYQRFLALGRKYAARHC
jgi:UPF0755 protein